MKKAFISFLCLFPLLCLAESGKIEFVEYTLDNGLHVILQEDHTTPNIVVSVMYHVGSKNENPQLTGFAHFFEHLMFEGTENIKRHEFDTYVTRVGGELNANTFFDRTYYYELLPSNELALGLWLESERMMHPTIEAIGIKTQKDVVCQEMGQSRDNRPYGRLLTETLKKAYTTHPYCHDVLGSEEHIRNASDQDFVDFHNKFYVPNNAVLTICGDFKPEEAKKLIHDYFNDIPAGAPVVQPTVVEPKQKAEVRDTARDNIQLPALILAYHIPGIADKDIYAVKMLNTLLAEGESSRLNDVIVNEKQLAMQMMAEPLPLEQPGLSVVMAVPNMNVELPQIEHEIDRVIADVQQKPISDREFQKLQNQIETGLVGANSTIATRAYNLAEAQTYLKNTNHVNEEIDNYRTVTKADLQRVANAYFNKENRVVLYYLPQE